VLIISIFLKELGIPVSRVGFSMEFQGQVAVKERFSISEYVYERCEHVIISYIRVAIQYANLLP
jgi:hypothetical protein